MTVTVCHDVYLAGRNLLPRLYTFSMVYRQEILTSIPPPKTNGKSILTWNDKSLSDGPAFSLFQWNNRDDADFLFRVRHLVCLRTDCIRRR